MAYFKPIFAFGRTSQKTVSASHTAGVTTITVDVTDDSYVAGDHVFISESTDTENQYLGQIVSVAANELSFVVEIPLLSAKQNTAKIWKPATFYRFSQGPGTQINDRSIPGTIMRRTRGGLLYVTQIADPLFQFTFDFSKERPGKNVDFEGIRDFIINQRNNGLQFFSCAFWNHLRQNAFVIRCLLQVGSLGADEQSSEIGLIGSAMAKMPEDGIFQFRLFAEDLDNYVES